MKLVSYFALFVLLAGGSVWAQISAPTLTPQSPQELPEGRGFRPPAIDLDHVARSAPAAAKVATLPTSWDWRTQGSVSQVKNQSSCGSCYSFAAAANFESRILFDGGSEVDLSENNIKECNYWQTSCDGGNYQQVADLLSKSGTVLESCDPYQAADVSCNSGCAYQHTLLDWHIIAGGVAPSTETLKQYIYDNGPVYTSLYTGDANDNAWLSEYNAYNGSYTMYYTGTYSTNHAVLIVGWDDALTHAGGTGGWIVKNSWGTSWGGTCGYGAESGYFTIAYGSASIGKWSSYVAGYQTHSSADELYYHDEGGWTTSWGYGATTCWGLAKFVVTSSHYITRVEFWTNDFTTDVDVYLYDDFNGSAVSNLLASKLDTAFTEPGYHSIEFASSPLVAASEDVYAVVKITNSSYTFPMVSDTEAPTPAATTYISATGSSGSWYDLGVNQTDDVAIRIRTSPTLSLGVGDNPDQLPKHFTLRQNYPNPFNPATTISYSLERRAAVELTVFNVLGQELRHLVATTQPAGSYNVVWDGLADDSRESASGVYWYRLDVNGHAETRKMVLLR